MKETRPRLGNESGRGVREMWGKKITLAAALCSQLVNLPITRNQPSCTMLPCRFRIRVFLHQFPCRLCSLLAAVLAESGLAKFGDHPKEATRLTFGYTWACCMTKRPTRRDCRTSPLPLSPPSTVLGGPCFDRALGMIDFGATWIELEVRGSELS